MGGPQKTVKHGKRRVSYERHLSRVDPALGQIIDAVVARMGPRRIKPSSSPPFEALVRAIVYQSVSGKAAATIFSRVKALMGGTFKPAQLLAKRRTSLAAAGLSGAKCRAIRDLAQWFATNPLKAREIVQLTDAEIIKTLTSIPGIGVWTANVFLIFSLGRLDVIPAGDLGIRRGVQLVCRLAQPASPKQVQARSERWQPYRSIASIYLWTAVKLNITQKDLKP
jgi:DNA-3-methyladenine glycosylase II